MRRLVRPYGSRCGRAMFSFAWWLALLIGFLSLSEEILWVRVAGFAYRTLPPAFSFVLMFYLLGIAAGASFGKYLCGRVKNLYAAAAVLLAVAALLDALTPLVISQLRLSERSGSRHPSCCDRTHGSIKKHSFPDRASSWIACERSARRPVGFQNLLWKHRGLHARAPSSQVSWPSII